ncbi:hypothetical protein ABMA28_005438 [Loxostege sticticalis]|uniref:Reverse transcriptase domain-containing protein n=1 Tax=Loxostege sticticalis TaxID=481309 RepID=A0ABD0SQG0_LOXSC
MELRSKSKRLMPLPGGDRRGAPGADAGRHSMRAIGGEGLGGRPFAGGPAIGREPEQCESTQSSQNQNINSPVTPVEDVSQEAPATKPATTKTGKPRVRMQWNDDINTFIMRTYYYITKLETDRTMYCKNLFDRFKLQYPHLNVTAQRIADQRRVILRNKLLSDLAIDNIKKEVRDQLKEEEQNELQSTLHSENAIRSDSYNSSFEDNLPLNLLRTQSDLTISPTSLTPQTLSQTQTRLDPSDTQHVESRNQSDDYIQSVTDMLETALTEYSGSDPTARPRLPRLRGNKKLYQLVDLFNNKILSKFCTADSDINHIHTLIYCSALVICKQLGYKIEPQNTHKHSRRSFKKPAWQVRLEKDIEKLRADIARVTQYITNNERSENLCNKVELIFKKNQLHSSHERNNRRPEEFLDTLKQKLSLKAQRLRRYKKALERKEDNKLFSTNEKVFYRNLGQQNKSERDISEQGDKELPTSEDLKNYWASIWEKDAEYNFEADWIKKEENRFQNIEEMVFDDVNRDDIEMVTRKMKSWKAAGTDGVHSFWYKKFYILHDILGRVISDVIKGNINLPQFLTTGVTFMLPKSKNTKDPSQYRPITCLPTLYKLITSCITNKLNSHIENNKILSEEQKGCRRNHLGCKEQLVIDSIILKHAHKHKRNINITYIDYQKAFDSVPHSWLIRVLQIYKVNPTIITFLESAMSNWKTTLLLNEIRTEEIPIRNGIFQGDSLSPLWFCLAMNPLSALLNDSNNGYKLTHTTSICHLMYMDDIKLFSKSDQAMKNLIEITKTFSKDINMKFGLDKCRTLRIVKGRVNASQNFNINHSFQSMDLGDSYKYLGIQQDKGIHHIKIKKELTQEYFRRINTLCKKHLYSKNLFKAINTFAVPVLTYSFGIIKWTKTDINKLEIRTRTTLTKHNYMHPKSAIQRTTQPHVDLKASNKWLKLGALFPETEGFMIAIQDQIINTRNYKKYILKDPHLITDKCRKCNRQSETIQHITSACPNLTQTDYTHRHNQICNIIHQKLAFKYQLLTGKPLPYYQYTPKPVLESSSHKMYFDRAILTDRTVHNNRPDITLIDKQNKQVYIIDVAVPNTHNLHKTITEKIHKYTELKEEIVKIWQMDKVHIVPLVLSSTGVIPRHLLSALRNLDIPESTYMTMQKAAILNTCRIVRRFLQDDTSSIPNSGNVTHLA